MKIRSSAVLSALAACSLAVPVRAQAPVSPAKPRRVVESIEAQAARKSLKQVLDAVNNTWFGKTYDGVNAVDLQGTMAIDLTAAAVNSKVNSASQGVIKANASGNTTVNLRLKGTYFANGDLRTELTGQFGNLLYYRSGYRGFLYSKELNAYTSRIDPPPADAPATFLGWFRQCVNEIQAVYVDGTTFRASFGKDSSSTQQTLVFFTTTGPYDAKKREQSMAESLGFWKRGRLEVVYDKRTGLPTQLNYSNENQGIFTRMTFSYNPNHKPNDVTIANQSKGMEGPASLTLGYAPDGTLHRVAGQMGFSRGTLRFDIDLAFAKGRKSSSIVTVPPPTAVKKSREEVETGIAVALAGKILALQDIGLNIRSNSLAGK